MYVLLDCNINNFAKLNIFHFSNNREGSERKILFGFTNFSVLECNCTIIWNKHINMKKTLGY